MSTSPTSHHQDVPPPAPRGRTSPDAGHRLTAPARPDPNDRWWDELPPYGVRPSEGPGQPVQARVSGLAQLAALVPYQLGFVPHASVVAIGLRGRRPTAWGTTQVCAEGIARIDLPRTGAEFGDVARGLALCISPTDPDDVLLLLFADRQVPLGAQPERPDDPLTAGVDALDLVELLTTTFGGLGIGVVDALWVEDGRITSLGCLGHGCCPPEGEPLPVPGEVPAVAELVATGAAPAADRQVLAASVAAGTDALAPLVARQLTGARAMQARRPVTDRTVLRRWRDAVLRPALARAVDPRRSDPLPPPASIARLVAELEWDDRDAPRDRGPGRPPRSLRDAVVAWCDPDAESVESLPPDVRATAFDVLGPCLPRTAGERTAVVERLAALVRCVPADACGPVSGVLAAVAWRAGDVVRARAAADQTLDVDPGHRIARLVRSALDHGLPYAYPDGEGARRRGGGA